MVDPHPVRPLTSCFALLSLIVSSFLWGDADVASAEAVVEAVADLERHEWDRETTAAVKIGPAHRRKMAGR